MNVASLETPYLQSMTYVVTENGHAVIIDPCELEEVKRLLTEKQLSVDFCLLTHEHCDHISGANWAHSLGAQVICSDECARRIQDSKKNGSSYFDDFIQLQTQFSGSAALKAFTCLADITYETEHSFIWQGHAFYLFKTPGHSEGSSCFLVDGTTLFCGDSLFFDLPVSTRGPGGSGKQYRTVTLPKLRALPLDTLVYPGHGKKFRMGEYTLWADAEQQA